MNYRLLIITLSMITASAPLYCMEDQFAPSYGTKRPTASSSHKPLPFPPPTFKPPFSQHHDQRDEAASSGESTTPTKGNRFMNWIHQLWSNPQAVRNKVGNAEKEHFQNLDVEVSEIAPKGNRFANWARQWWNCGITVKTKNDDRSGIYSNDIKNGVKNLAKLYYGIEAVRWHRTKIVAPLAAMATAGMMHLFGSDNALLYGAGTGAALGTLTYFGSLFGAKRQAVRYESYLNDTMRHVPYADLKNYALGDILALRLKKSLLPNYPKDGAYLKRATHEIYARKEAERQEAEARRHHEADAEY